jgi:hypothetical protein
MSTAKGGMSTRTAKLSKAVRLVWLASAWAVVVGASAVPRNESAANVLQTRRSLLFGTIAEGAERRPESADSPAMPARADPSLIKRLSAAHPPAASRCAQHTSRHDSHQRLLEVRW